MINTKELTLERERIKDKFSELLDALIEKRSKMKKRRSRHVISMSDVNKLREIFFFYIDDPNYVRLIERTE